MDGPFFCYLPITPPHGMYDIPADDPAWDQYGDADWVKDPDVPQDPPPPTRAFDMGFTTWPYDDTVAAVNFV